MREIYLVSGMSGSGVSTAMGIFEDLGAYCVERIPSEVIPELIKYINGTEFDKIAIAVPLFEVARMEEKLRRCDINPIVVLTEASNETILRRYKLTRHLHPKVINGTFVSLEDAIEDDRVAYKQLPQFEKSIIIDTDSYNQQELKEIIERKINHNKKKMGVIFWVFGYKYEIPHSSDLMVDTRSLPNPYWKPELRDKTGDDEEVYDYVINSDKAKEFLPKIDDFLDYMLENYKNENRTHVVISVGCTGGQHRSLSVARYLYDRYKNLYDCSIKRRN